MGDLFKMNKKIFFLLIIFLLSISIVNAVEEYGLYEIDNNEILNTTFSNSDVSHLRDNYYGVVYNDGSNNGILRVIEVDNNNNLINSSVDTWNFGSSAFYPKIENFNSVDGVSVIAYQDNGGSSDIIFKSF